MTATAPPPLPADLTDGLERLKLSAMRFLAPELLVTAKTQRWKPEEFLRTLIEAEIAAREASNARNRTRAAAFPVTKTLAEFDLPASSIPTPTFDYLACLEWIRAAENVCLIGPCAKPEPPPPAQEGAAPRPPDQPRGTGTTNWPPAATTTWPLTAVKINSGASASNET